MMMMMMVNKPTSSNESGAMEGVALNLLAYLEFKSSRNETLKDIMKKVTGSSKIFEMLKAYVKDNPEMKNYILMEQSRDVYNSTPKVRYDTRGFNAYTFKNPKDDNCTVVYRGTASGGWIQNGVAFGLPQDNTYYSYEKDAQGQIYVTGKKIVNEHLSTVQAYAINYFNYNAVKYDWNESTYITVTGHSQGDCNAKLVTLTSPLIDECFGFNGPNFSKETIAELKVNRGLYECQRKKINIYRTDNDQISIFGYEVVENKQIYYLQGSSTMVNHEIDKMLSIIYDEHGNSKIVFNEYLEGPNFIATTLKNYNNILMELPEEIRGAVTIGAMWFAQKFLGRDKSVFNDRVKLWNICLAVVTSGVVIPQIILQGVEDKYGSISKYIAAILVAFVAIKFAPLIIGMFGSIALVGLINFAIDKIITNGVQYMNVTNKLVELLTQGV